MSGERYSFNDAYIAGAVSTNLYGAEKLIQEACARVLTLEIGRPERPMYDSIQRQLKGLREVRKAFDDSVGGRAMSGGNKP
jgi:hypothetical protein